MLMGLAFSAFQVDAQSRGGGVTFEWSKPFFEPQHKCSKTVVSVQVNSFETVVSQQTGSFSSEQTVVFGSEQTVVFGSEQTVVTE
jgi:hypothetical protein